MAHQPNANAQAFCQWIEDNSWLKFSAPQLNLIAIIKASAIAVTPVTDTQWKNFLTTTTSRYQIYLQAIDQET